MAEEWETIGSGRQEHHAAVGGFIAVCSLLESHIHVALRSLLEVDEAVGRILINRLRLGTDIIGIFNDIAAAKGATAEYLAQLELIRQQVAYVTCIRAVVAHYPFFGIADRLRFSQARSARASAKAIEWECSIDDLRTLCNFVNCFVVKMQRLTKTPLDFTGDIIGYRFHTPLYIDQLADQLPPDPGGNKPPQSGALKKSRAERARKLAERTKRK